MEEHTMNTSLYPGHLNVEPRTDGGIGIYIESKEHPLDILMLTRYEALQLAKWLVQYLVVK
jgi:hypothetical protein